MSLVAEIKVRRGNSHPDFLTAYNNELYFGADDGSGTFGIELYKYSLPNSAPTDIILDSTSVLEDEHAGTVVGNLVAADIDPGDTHTFALVAGAGDTDNASFQVVGSELQSTTSFDFESKSSYSIRLQVTDSAGGMFEKQFAINVTDVAEQSVFINGDGNLQVEGMAGTDEIIIAAANGGRVSARFNGTTYTLAPSGNTIVINAHDGENTIVVAGNLVDFNTIITTTGNGRNYVAGGGGGDSVTTGAGDDTILTSAGNDTISSGGGDDKVDAGSGDDTLDTGDGSDSVVGGSGNDTIRGGAGADLIAGGDGDDVLLGEASAAEMAERDGNEVMVSGGEAHQCDGRLGNDLIIGGMGGDNLQGNAENDLLISGETDDNDDPDTLRLALAEWQSNNLSIPSQLLTTALSPDGAADGVNGHEGADFHVVDASDNNFRLTAGDNVQIVT